MDWEFFWVILVVVGLDGYLYWHFSNIFNIQFEITNKMLTTFQKQQNDKAEPQDLGFDITGNEVMQPEEQEE